MLHVGVHTTTCFHVLRLRREEPTTNSSSNIPYLADTVLRTAAGAAGSGSSNERQLCEPLPQHLTSVNSEDKRERRCITRAPLLRLSRSLSYLFGPTDALFAVCSILCLFFFYRAGVVNSLSFPTFFTYALLITALGVSRIRRKGLKHMQALGLLAAVKCAVRCARLSVLVVVHPACVRCSFDVILLFPKAKICFR